MFLLGYYEKLGLKDSAEHNEVSIVSDFCLYNLEFAKEKLRLPDDKAALLLNILFPFISFKHLDSMGTYIDDSEWSEEKCKEKLGQRFETFRESLLAFSADNPPHSMKVFEAETLASIVEYATKTYFSHFALFAYTTGKIQKVQEKKMTIFPDEPMHVLTLKDAVLIPPKDNVKSPPKAEQKKVEEKVEQKEEHKVSEKKEEEKSVETMLEELALSEEGKKNIQGKLKEMKDEVAAKLAERQKKLHEKLEEMKSKNKPAKKQK